MLARLITVFVCGASLVFAAPPTRPDARAFMTKALAQWKALIAKGAAHGNPPYLNLAELVLGQDQVSVDNMLQKLEEKIANGDVVWEEASQQWKLKHDGGKSSVPEIDPIQVIKGKQGYVIKDGHHDFFLSLFLGAETIAADVVETSNADPVEFWRDLKKRNLIYLKESPEELAKKTHSMEEVRDNPNRFLAALLALKAEVRGTSDSLKVGKVKVLSPPIWIKVNDSVAFIEFYIAEVLSRAGIQYDPTWGTNIPKPVVAKARRALINAQKSGEYPELKDIPLIASAKKADQIKKGGEPLAAEILKFMAQSEDCLNAIKRVLKP